MGMEVEIVKDVNRTNISSNKKSYRVKFSLDNGGYDHRNFSFMEGDSFSKIKAFEEAVKFRDATYIRNSNTNTGYKNINVIKIGKKIYVNAVVTVKAMTTTEQIELTKSVSFNKALDQAVKYICNKLNIGMPTIINYDFGLSIAYKLGYKGHRDDKKLVARRLKKGELIRDPDTKDVGKITKILDDFSYLAVFETGKRTRYITDELLFNNISESRVKRLEDISAKIKSGELENKEVRKLSEEVEEINFSNKEDYRDIIENKNITEEAVTEMLVIRKKKKRVALPLNAE